MFRSIDKAVALILQSSPKHGQLWKAALESQGFKVIWGSPDIDILSSIQAFQPEIALIDISKGTFNPFEISRQSAKDCPSSSIVFTNHKRKQIFPSERQWAIEQQAADLISTPKTFTTLRSAVARIVELSNTPISFNPQALTAAIVHYKRSRRSTTPTQDDSTPETQTESAPKSVTESATLPIERSEPAIHAAATQPLSQLESSTRSAIQTLATTFANFTDLVTEIATLPDATATDPNPKKVQTAPLYRGRQLAGAANTTVSETLEPTTSDNAVEQLDTGNLESLMEFDSDTNQSFSEAVDRIEATNNLEDTDSDDRESSLAAIFGSLDSEETDLIGSSPFLVW